MLKRLSSCAKRLGALSLSTRVPDSNTSTCSASKMEETRCCVRGRETGGQRRRKKRGGKGDEGEERKTGEKVQQTEIMHLFRAQLCSLTQTKQKGHFCVSVALNDRLQWLQAYKILMSHCVNAKRLIVTDCQLSEVVKKDKTEKGLKMSKPGKH